MIEIIGPALNQWDVKRSVKATGIEADHLHFANKGDLKAVIMEIAEEQVKIPDYLLQTGKQLCVYAVKDGVTIESDTFFVRKRERPENYVYEDDQRNYIYELITDAVKATEAASRAAENANPSADKANAATENANKAAYSANEAAKNANEAAAKAANTAKSLMVVGTAVGDVIHLDDAIDQYLVGLRIFGKTTQDGKPSPEAPVDLVSVGDGGNLSVSVAEKNLFGGDALADRLVKISNATKDAVEGTVQFNGNNVSKKMLYSGFKKGTVYTIILKGWNTYGDGSNLWIKYTDGSVAYLTFPAAQTLSTIVYKTPAGKTVEMIGGVEYAGATYLYYDQCGVFEGDIAIGDFEAYIGQNISINTPNGLPGIPVTSGGNYTDANGQQWVCDEIDLASGTYVQRVTDVTYRGSEGWIAFGVYNGLYRYHCLLNDVISTGSLTDQRVMSSTLPTIGVTAWSLVTAPCIALHPTDMTLNAFVPFSTVDEWEAYLAENPMNVIYQLAEPKSTHISNEEELAVYAALQTYRDHTTVSNDAGAYMELEYVMDAKKYIDSMISGTILAATVE